jgi:hypothetical protein
LTVKKSAIARHFLDEFFERFGIAMRPGEDRQREIGDALFFADLRMMQGRVDLARRPFDDLGQGIVETD